MSYTVQQVARLSGVTVKTLYHYQKTGLLQPAYTGANGYRYYGDRELETLQEILFYRELDFSLAQIKEMMESEPSRLGCLRQQKKLLQARRQRTGRLLRTLDEAIACTEKGAIMHKETMFSGLNREEWEQTLSGQNDYLKEEYGYDMLAQNAIEPDALNDQSQRVTKFMGDMAEALRTGIRPDDHRIRQALGEHIAYINREIHPTDAQSFLQTAEFALTDDFHRSMYEGLQTGLSYYLFACAELYARQQ